MASINSERFVEMVGKSRLIDDAVQERFLKKVREKCDGGLPTSARRLAAAYKRAGLLTDWHLEKLFAGKYKGFFLNKYKLLGHIGTGGMSSVYLAEHVGLGDKRAIKVLPKRRNADSSYLARFKLEAKAIASLNHRNIVLAHDIDQAGDTHYIVMEYVDGVDLQMLVRRDGVLDFSTAADVVAQAARGLAHAHQRGVVHRDVKPANLLIDQEGVVRLLDMGLALVTGTSADSESLTVANNENVLGTADYLAPEQALNSHGVDHRVDIYGLGCTLYFLLTGRPPFADGTLAQRIAKHQKEMPRSIRQLRPDCPGELEGICVKMIQKQPEYRYQTADAVAEVLEKFHAAVPKGEKIRIGLGEGPDQNESLSSLSFDSSHDNLLDSQSTHDTVTNKNDDTLASSRSKLIREQNAAASDSGKLVEVKSKGLPSDMVSGSYLDLEKESGYDQHFSSRPTSNATPSTAEPARNRVAAKKQGIDPTLLITILVAIFVAALALGFFLAKVTQ
ncbi:MAG: serine/threonine-protein kinase [Planctomycetota bacterium]